MAIAGAPTHRPKCRCAPRPELKPPHYHGGPWRVARCRGVKGEGGCALDEAAAGESVLRILEVMSRAVLYNTRFPPFKARNSFPELFLQALHDAATRSTFRATEDSAFASVRLMLPEAARAEVARSASN
ncbi:hypothetical protein X777_08216 [Ooceraea biroi]|uniref:Uncharacterized protein n=1 Tax=Ooceraea biroi TaxID=2015173 RepID=A0A026X0T2_OOCBI|nr:hypothetical protein X777_08216 [Ooceraea biroi]